MAIDKIVCVGKNYAEHARELGDEVPEKPVLFLKPPSVLRSARAVGERIALRFPAGPGPVHYECEIVLRICEGGFRMALQEAQRAIGEATVGLDMTLRDLQNRLKKAGHPWEVCKVFPDSAVVGPWRSAKTLAEDLAAPFSFSLDGKVRQRGYGRDMILSPAECVAYASEHFELCPGDLLFTGTPAGVGPVNAGQAGVLEWGDLRYSVEWEPQ